MANRSREAIELPDHNAIESARQRLSFHPREPLLKVKRSATEILKRLAILSRVSNDGAFLPRSIKVNEEPLLARQAHHAPACPAEEQIPCFE